jgi:hypothetical protein
VATYVQYKAPQWFQIVKDLTACIEFRHCLQRQFTNNKKVNVEKLSASDSNALCKTWRIKMKMEGGQAEIGGREQIGGVPNGGRPVVGGVPTGVLPDIGGMPSGGRPADGGRTFGGMTGS